MSEGLSMPHTEHPGGGLLAATVGLSRLRDTAGYELAMRAATSTWFLVLAVLEGWIVLGPTSNVDTGEFRSAEWPGLVSRLCLVVFYLTVWALVLLRPRAEASAHGFGASVTALLGTYLPWSVPLLGQGSHVTGWLHLVSAALLLAGSALALVTVWYLGRSFSILPQVRRLVRSGPYRIVRHPLYLAEEIAVLGAVLQYLSPLTAAVFVVHCILQVRRMLYEESLLRSRLPDYAAYAASSARVIPYVW
jgi:protein-S-isoprenylcysteine O-methyltransferase Ste14